MNEALHTVYLVGAGPGDPELITVKGASVLRQAEVVIADRLVAPELLQRLSPKTEVIVRGEKRSALSQEAINHLLVEKARTGKRVVRLKGGDPFVFGRGGEEAEVLRDAGIPFEIVPGVTAAIAAPAYAGIPVTHRGLSGAVAFVTGHETDEKSSGHIDWCSLARGAGTIVLYMSVTHLPGVVERLLAAGRSPSTPVAIIERGTTLLQRTITGTLGDIVETARAANVQPPALTIVGEVVKLRDELSWFDKRKPLAGLRVLQLGPDLLNVVGSGGEYDLAEVEEWQPIEERYAALGLTRQWIQPLALRSLVENLRSPLQNLRAYAWLAFTSVNAVDEVADALCDLGSDSRAFAGLRVACLEGKTERAVSRSLRLRPDVVATGGGAALAEAILRAEAPHGPVLFPRVAGGREELPERLRAAGVEVNVVDAYDAEANPEQIQIAVRAHRASPFAAIAFGSPRGVDAWLDGGGGTSGILIGAIGNTTAAALTARGISVDVVASRPSYPVLLDELATALAQRAGIK